MILFISDLHLQLERPDITRAFFDFLSEQANQAQALMTRWMSFNYRLPELLNNSPGVVARFS